ncbi:MAG: L-serine ammonia-lyase, iron-sulfur-dependent, subunit alpha [Bacteroidaceae bacterium]|nr:L-serine ammonia-lyase, iron-sulfur-dependent, subunit alpha [Bacteroidaceae bacterium]
MDKTEYEELLALVKQQMVPAMGCTEPIAVALAAAKMRTVLEQEPEQITVSLSANIVKNAMGVGIPGTGMVGLPIAIALGVLIGKSEAMLEVLEDCDQAAVIKGKEMINANRISISLKEDVADKLYIEVEGFSGTQKAKVIIQGKHTNFVYLSRNETVLLDRLQPSALVSSTKTHNLSLRKVYDFSTTAPFADISFILEAGRLNKEAAELSLKQDYGHSLGRTLQGKREEEIMGKSIFADILSYTSAACDARMAGAKIPIMSNSGSGNQGIATTIPIVIYAERIGASQEQLARALLLSSLTAIYIKQSLDSLSALCGCVVAATGSSCGITYLMGGDYLKVTYAVKNMIANLTGIICDGAKPSCSLKLSSGVSTAVLSAMLAMEGKSVSSTEGIIDEDVDKSIRNLTDIGSKAMNETDKMILDIMVHKQS